MGDHSINPLLELSPLEQIANHLRAMRPDMQRMGDAINPVLMADVLGYVKDANLVQCKAIIDALVDRVSDLVGCAPDLEDASCQLAVEIESKLCEGRR